MPRVRPRHMCGAFLALALAFAPPAKAEDTAESGEAAQSTLSLEGLTKLALQGGRSAQARARIAAAAGKLAEARGAAFPKARLTTFVGPSPSIQCLNDDCTRTNNTGLNVQIEGAVAGVDVTLAQPLYTFGKIAKAKAAAKHAMTAQKHLSEAQDAEIAVECARAFYGLKLGRDLVWMLEDGQEQVAKALEKIREDLAAGEDGVTVQDRLRLETFAAEIAVRLADARLVEGTALAAVRALASSRTVDIGREPLAAVTYEREGKTASSSAEMRAAEAGVVGARAFEAFQRAQYMPNLVLVAGLNLSRSQGAEDPPSVYANDPFNNNAAQLGLMLRWDLDFVAQRGRVRQAHAQTLGLVALHQAAESKAHYERDGAEVALVQARAKLEAAEAGERAAKGWLASVLQAQAIGTLEAKDLVDAYIAFFTMKTHWLRAVHDWNVAVSVARKAHGEYRAASGRPSP